MESLFSVIGLFAAIVITSVVLCHLYMRQHHMTRDTAQHVKYHI